MGKKINQLNLDIRMCLNNDVYKVQALDEAKDRGRTAKELLSMLTKKYVWQIKKIKKHANKLILKKKN